MEDSAKKHDGHFLKVADLSSANYLAGDAVDAYCLLMQRGTQPGLKGLTATPSPADASIDPPGLAEVHSLLSEMAGMMKQMHAAIAAAASG